MTDHHCRDGSVDDAPPISTTDPAALRDRDDVDVREDRRVADAEDFEEHANWAGMAVVGIVDDGRLLLLENEDGRAIIPHRPVEPGADYAAVARDGAEDAVGVPVRIEAVERVRHVRYRLDGDRSRRTDRHDVVFAASPATDATPTSDRGCWTATWADDLPADPHPDDAVLADARLFLD